MLSYNRSILGRYTYLGFDQADESDNNPIFTYKEESVNEGLETDVGEKGIFVPTLLTFSLL